MTYWKLLLLQKVSEHPLPNSYFILHIFSKGHDYTAIFCNVSIHPQTQKPVNTRSFKKTHFSAILNMNGFHCIVHTCDIGVLPRIMKTYRSDKFRIVKEHASLFSDKSFLCQCTYSFTLLIFIYVTLYNKGT